MRMQTKCTRAQRAAEYLKRVAALTGAKQGDDISPRPESTCFSVVADLDMPSAEVVASALLQLKNDASLFEKWRDWPAHTFKVNGKMSS